MAATRITRGRLSPESEKFLDDVLEELRKSGASEEEINNASSGLTDAVFAASTKSPSPAFSSSSASANLSSVIGCPPALQVKVLQLHLSRSAPMTTSNSPAARHCGSAQNSTTSVDANQAKWGMTSEAKSSRGLSVVPIAIDQQVDAGAAVLSDQVERAPQDHSPTGDRREKRLRRHF